MQEKLRLIFKICQNAHILSLVYYAKETKTELNLLPEDIKF